MKLRTLISLKNEPLLEKWARFFRFTKVDFVIQEKISSKKKITLIDFGCGQDILYYKYIVNIFPEIIDKLTYIGIDPLVDSQVLQHYKNVKLINKKFEVAKLSEKADVIVLFAVLEHVEDPTNLLHAATKLLKPDGVIVITTPSPLARYPLEFFSYVLGIIAKREIDEHKRYPDRAFLLGLRKKLKGLVFSQEYFELGLNNLCVVSKRRYVELPTFSVSRDFRLIITILLRSLREI